MIGTIISNTEIKTDNKIEGISTIEINIIQDKIEVGTL